jgi:HEPN domain-containing protein
MKTPADLARGWLLKAASDLAAARVCLRAGTALDVACFHCQQAAEKSLKGFLIAHQVDFPFTHDLNKLVPLCATLDPEFQTLLDQAASLNPYAVEMRYDYEFWPTAEEVEDQLSKANAIHQFVMARVHLPPSPT